MATAHVTDTSNDVLLERIKQARRQSDELFSIVKPEFIYERPIAERHRIVFYIGHLEAFDWNLLRERVLQLESFNPEFDRLFAFGIDPVGSGLPSDQPKDWPAIESVRDYVVAARGRIDDAFATQSSAESNQLLNVAIEHRLMHVETLAYMLHQLPHDHKRRPPHRPALITDPVSPSMTDIPSGLATLGMARNAMQFGWDNEYEIHRVEVPAF